MQSIHVVLVLIIHAQVFAAFDYPMRGFSGGWLASLNSTDAFVHNPAAGIGEYDWGAGLSYMQLYSLAELGYISGHLNRSWKKKAFGAYVESLTAPGYQETQATISSAFYVESAKLALGLSISYYMVGAEGYKSLSAMGVRLGCRYIVFKRLAIHSVIENFNRVTFGQTTSEAPIRTSIGFRFALIETWDVGLLVRKDAWLEPEIVLGSAYRLNERIGITLSLDPTLSLPAVGLDLKVARITVNYTLQHHFDLGQNHLVGIGFRR